METNTLSRQSRFADRPISGALVRGLQLGMALALKMMRSRIFARIRDYMRHQQEKSRLYRLSDRDLSDMRLARSEIQAIYEPNFERRRRK